MQILLKRRKFLLLRLSKLGNEKFPLCLCYGFGIFATSFCITSNLKTIKQNKQNKQDKALGKALNN